LLRILYTWLLRIVVPVASLVLLARGLRRRDYWRGWRERFGYGYAAASGGIWLHAVSVGEVQAAQVLARRLRVLLPDVPLTLTTATPTGRALAQQASGLWVQVRYAPYDLPGVQRRVLRTLFPGLLVILETELWPNQLHCAATAGLPVLLVSARITERTASALRRWPGLLSASALENLTVLAQSTDDAERYASLGIAHEQIMVAGNLKFDREADAATLQRGNTLRAQLAGTAPLWVAGSTRPGEEPAVLAAHRALLAQHPNAVLVLAPRHRERVAEVAALLRQQQFRFQLRSMAMGATVEVLLLDTMGELNDFYAAADLAFVGGSLEPLGGHNLLEPAVLGVATVTGPHHASAPDVLRTLRQAAAVSVVTDGEALAREVLRLMNTAAARAALAAAARVAVAANRGALDAAVQQIRARLSAPTLVW
jgi:3-deoxy-D-manno-octulosonic-acid transferase